jgi:eukaryotic-like serine/threonine-protein kinase
MATHGTRLGGRFRLLDVLGEGGMAVVWRARDELLDRDVAVKVLRDQYAADPNFVRRFRQEARNAAALDHPNIVPVFDTGIDEGVEYIVMAVVDGPDLDAVLADRGRLPVAEALRIGIAVAEALAAAHARGIVHRDIKPGNILLAPDNEVRVVDFGIARALGDSRTTTAGLLLGSVQYCSPEQVTGDEVGPASDLFSLGVVLYELLTGRRPWDGPTPASAALARLRDRPPAPSTLVPDLPDGIDALVLRAMAREPADRYPSAAAMADAIRQWWRQHRRSTGGVAVPGAAVGGAMAATAAARDASPTVAGATLRRGGRSGGRLAPAVAGSGAGSGTWSPGGVHGGPPPAAPRPGAADDDDERRRRTPFALWLLPAAALVVAVAILGILGLTGDRGGVLSETASPSPTQVAVASAGVTPSPRPATPVPTSTPAPTPSPSPTPSPTAPPTPSPTPVPTPVPTARPTATPAPTRAPTPVPPARTGPTETVARFYFLVDEGRFDEAAALWTSQLRERYPPREYIDGRFAPTESIDLDRNDLIAYDESAGTAVVGVDLTEVRRDGEVRRFVGSWDLVRTDAGWRMSDPDF